MKSTLLYEDIVAVNRRFGGHLHTDSSLKFALDFTSKMKSKHRITAHLIRAIIVHHTFTDANKRTAYYVIGHYLGIKNEDRVIKAIMKISKESIDEIDKIIEVVKNANR